MADKRIVDLPVISAVSDSDNILVVNQSDTYKATFSTFKSAVNSGIVQMNQGISNAGKALIVGNDGMVTLGFAASDEGKVVSNGALVAQTARASEITANGMYDTTTNNSVTVNVPNGTPIPSISGMYYTFSSTSGSVALSEAIGVFSNESGEITSNYFMSDYDALQIATFPNCEAVGEQAFIECNNLQSVYLPNCLSVGDDAFAHCTSLQSISLPACTYIGWAAFEGAGLTSIFLPVCSSIGEAPPYSGAFYNCLSLETVILPVCRNLGSYTFQDCYRLSYISVPACSSVGCGQFKNCSSLSEIDLPKCEYIGDEAFFHTGLTEISLPKCEYIGDEAFLRTGLTEISLPVCYSIGFGAFMFCDSLSSVYLPSCLSIGGYAFSGTALQELSLPACGYIGADAFDSCLSLVTASATACSMISDFAFYDCENLISFYIGYIPCSLGEFAFEGTPIDGYSDVAGRYGSIFVPESMVSYYQSAQNWSEYASRITGY